MKSNETGLLNLKLFFALLKFFLFSCKCSLKWVSIFVVLQKQGLTPEELQQRRAELLNKHQLELSALDRQQSAEEADVEQQALTDWELRCAHEKLELKEKHYKVVRRWLLLKPGSKFELVIILFMPSNNSCQLIMPSLK